MRSSLALASEQDPAIMLCALLRILCQVRESIRASIDMQFSRADYAAIALRDDSDSTVLRIRAAGWYASITPYDMSIADPVAQTICPVSHMLHVYRTTKVSRLSLPIQANAFIVLR